MPAAGMSRDRWLRVKDIVGAALETPDARVALIAERCGDDAALRADVESMLQACADASAYLEAPIVSLLGDESEPYIGQTFGSYLIEESIGRGGMGTVYLARRADQAFERRVAIKTIRRGMDSDLVVGRFRHERQILASLDHPNIGALFDGGTGPDGLPYFVMEYIDGIPIDRYADDHRLDTSARVELCLPILDAVQHAHERLIVHRDIKPTNLLVTSDGHPKLLDFGIAKILDPESAGPSTLTSMGRPMTPDYASPEQLRGEPITASTDVYALGVLLYELLTGHRPFGQAVHSPEEMARIVADQDPERPSTAIARTTTLQLHDGSVVAVTPDTISATRDGSPALLRRRLSGALDEILLKALRREPAERYGSVAALAGDLRLYLSEQPTKVSWDARRYRAKRFLRRYRAVMLAAALVVGAVTTTAVITQLAATGGASTAATSSQAANRPSVAVIEFRNLSARPVDDWMSTALAEMLMTELGGDGQLRVVPGERVARVRGELNNSSATPPGDVTDRLRTALASDHAIVGTFAVTDGAAPRPVRIDLRIHQAGADPIAVAAAGDEGQLFALVSQVGRDLRARLGLRESSPDATRGARAGYPQTLEATKLYAEGVARLRLLDAVSARALLEDAAGREPDNPLIQMALASSWTALGYDARAAAAAQKAFEASGGLNREERMNVEGRLYEVQRKWSDAVDVLQRLWGFFSDNVDYGLRLAAAQTAGGQAKEAIKTIEAMRRLPEPHSRDPRIDLELAQASGALGDFRAESAAIQLAVDGAERSGVRLLIARARLLEGRSYFNRSELGPAEESLTQAQTIFLEVGDRAGAASALNSLGVVLGDTEDIARAERMLEQSLAISEEIGDRRAMSAALNNLGISLKDRRQLPAARRAHERALALRREIGDRNWTATSLNNIGVVLFEEDRLGEAAKYYRESLSIMRELGDQRGEARALHNLAIVDRELGHLSTARSEYEATLVVRDRIGDKGGGVTGRVELGLVLQAQGELAAAGKVEAEALAIARELGLKSGEAQTNFQLAQIARASGNLAEARRLHDHALQIRRALNETRTVLESRVAMAELAVDEGRAADAQVEALELAKQFGNESERALAIAIHILLARTWLALGDPAAADRALAAARPLSQRTERLDPRHAFALIEADVDAALGRRDRARERLSSLCGELARLGMAIRQLECRTSLVRLDRAEGRQTWAADAAKLREDAKQRGAGLVLRWLDAL